MHVTHAFRCVCLTLSCLSVAGGASSQDEEAYLEALPVVLTASRLPQPLHEAPGAVTVIDRELIAATGYRELARVLRLVPGMQVGKERGHAQWVTYHGLSNDFPTEMQVLIDGRSVISPSAFGGVDWSALPITIDEIERIEVVRGTNASGFGANAFLGVINIITRHSADLPGASGKLRVGRNDTRDLDVGWSGGSGNLSFRLNGATRRDDGFAHLHDTRRMDTVSLRGDWQVSTDDSLMLRAAASDGRRGEGYPDSVFGNNGLRDTHTHTHALHLQWRHSASASSEWLLSYYRNHEDIEDEWFASAPPFFPAVPLDRNRQSMRDNLELQQRSILSPALQLVWGAEARRDEIDAPFLFHSGGPPKQWLYRLFGNAEWRMRPDLTVNLGGAQERYSGAAPHFSPRLFANWQASASDTWRAGFARAYRQRTPFEVYGDIHAIGAFNSPSHPRHGESMLLVRPFVPNPGLRQARIDAIELGYLGRLTRANTTLDVRIFKERIHNFIVRSPFQDPAPLLRDHLGSSRYENLGHAVNLHGIEYQLVTRPAPGTELRLAHSMISRHTGRDDIDDRVAPYTASFSWRQDWGAGWDSMLTVLRMGPLAGGDGFVPRFSYVAKPYTTVDVNIAYRTRLGPQPVKLSLSAVNLGKRHQEFADRTEQALHGERPVNRVSPGVFFAVAFPLQ